MGQYYKIVNVDKKEILVPWDYGNGAKLMEWSYQGNPLVNAWYNLMKNDWRGDRVYVVGDYAENDNGNEVWQETLEKVSKELGFYGQVADENNDYIAKGIPINLYAYASAYFKNVSNENDSDCVEGGVRYIFNNKLKCYIDLSHLPINHSGFNPWQGRNCTNYICPLSLLLAMGNGRGGGDYHDNYPGFDEVGSWCDTSEFIEVSADMIHPDYEEYEVVFTEGIFEIEKPVKTIKFTWDQIFENAIDKPYGSRELRAKDNARYELRAIIMNSMDIDINDCESAENEIHRFLTAHPDTFYFGSNGHLVEKKKGGVK